MSSGEINVSSSSDFAKNYPGRVTWYLFLACSIAACGGFNFGYDIRISGGVVSMTPFLQEFFPSIYRKDLDDKSTNQYCIFESQILNLFTSILYLVAPVASIVASTVTTKRGRKFSITVGGLCYMVGAVINAAAIHVAMLFLGRIILGIGVGFAHQSVPLFLSEMAPYKYRGALNIGFQLMITVGILFANLVNYFTAKIEGNWGWRLSLFCASVTGAVITIGGISLPETPNSLIERNENEEAIAMLQRIRGTEDVHEEFGDLNAAGTASRDMENPFKYIWQPKYRPQLSMAILIPFFQQLTGINAIMFYAPILFKAVGFGYNAALKSAVITGGVNVIATFVSIVFCDMWGRRKLLIQGGVQMFISLTVVAILVALKFGVNGNANDWLKAYDNLMVVFICVYVSGFAWSWGPLGWLVPSEILPLEIRSAAQSISVAMNMGLTFLIAQFFPIMMCHMKYGLLLFFVFWVFIMTIFIFFMLPETKGVSIDEMWRVWKKHRYWGKYIPDEAANP